MNQRTATQLAHALVVRSFDDFDDKILSGLSIDDRQRVITALARIRTFHAGSSGAWIEPGRPLPQPLPSFDRFREAPPTQKPLA